MKAHNPLSIRGAHLNMINSYQGGMKAVALMLGDETDVRLKNQAYELKGMVLPTERSLLIQDITDRTDFAEAVAYLSGGVFVKLPSEELVSGDINEMFMQCTKSLGELVAEFQKATENGVVDKHELAHLSAIKMSLCAQAVSIIRMTEQVFCKVDCNGR